MKISIIAVLAIIMVIAVFGSVNFYIGLRNWQLWGNFIPFLNRRIYWIVFWLVAVSFLLGRLASRVLPGTVNYWLTWIGSYWMAAMLYFTLILVLIDLFRLANRFLHFIPERAGQNPVLAMLYGFSVLALVIGILIYGTWNARNPIVKHYELQVDKAAGSIKTLHIAMVSDLHLGTVIDNGRLKKMVDMVNALDPDIVLLAGDIVDEDFRPFAEQNMGETFKKLKSKYGVYGVLGNHEYYGGHLDDIVNGLEEAGIKVLRDQSVKVADSFYLVGREDRSVERGTSKKRMKLEDLMRNIDRSLPVIVMDHQPFQLEEAEQQGADLQLSGHTHRGQMFPNQWITNRIYEVDWGYLRKGNLNVIVSSGFGTWGPPLRTGNQPEVVEVMVRFK